MSQITTPAAAAAPPAPVLPGVVAAAEDYRRRRLALARIGPGLKTPTTTGWSTRSAEPGEFRPDEQVAIMLGPLSDAGRPGHALVCVDLDSAEALAAADQFLPPTEMVDERPGKPGSHRYFSVPHASVPGAAWSTAEQAAPAARAACGHPGPKKASFRDAGGRTHFDLLGTGAVAVCPPSVHPSGETRVWEGGVVGAPAVVAYDDLWAALCRLATATGALVPGAGAAGHTRSGGPTPLPARGREADAAAAASPIPPAARLDLARKYLAAIPQDELSRSGRGGHDRFFAFLSAVANGHLVRDGGDLRDLAAGYNARLAHLDIVRPGEGFEPWASTEVAHKIDDVLAAGPPDGKAPGWLLPDRGEVPRTWDDSIGLADRVTAAQTLRAHKDYWYEHDGRAYRPVTSVTVECYVHNHAAAAAVEHHRTVQSPAHSAVPAARRGPPPTVPKVTGRVVHDAVAALRARVRVDDDTPFDVHLSDGRPRDRLALGNGVLDLGHRALLPHDPDWFTRVALSVDFDPAAPRPARWLGFVAQVTRGDPALAALLQEVVGWCLDRHSGVQAFVMLVGAGANGKSVFLLVLRLLLGDRNVAGVGLESLAGNGSRFDAYGLLGKLANLQGDQPYFESGDESALKKLTGGDLCRFEEKGKQPVYQVNRCKLLFACNHLPTFRDRSEGTWRRAVLIPFEWTVPEEARDPALMRPDHWAGELPGILNWALDGLDRLRLRERFDPPPACVALAAEHRRDSDPVHQFLEDRYEYTGEAGHRVSTEEMYAEYAEWCKNNGYNRPVVYNTFAKQVGVVFPRSEAKTVRFSDGLKKARVGLRPAGAPRPAGGGLFSTHAVGPETAV